MPERFGPILLTEGMYAALPPQRLGPQASEQLFNLFYNQIGRPQRRPGSVWVSRIGAGPVLALHEHRFNSFPAEPRVVAVVANRYTHSTTLTDPSFGSGVDGEAQGQVGLAIDALTHNRPVLGFAGRPTDRFTLASLFDRLYLAGSTIDYRVRWYDYVTGQFSHIPGFRATGVLAYRERLYAWGDPNQPHLLYPSNYAEPETFRPELAIQVGDDNAPIITCLRAFGLIVIFTPAAVYQYLGFAPETGDLELDVVDPIRGIAGPLAATVGGDGFVYWLAPEHGPCRWRRGLAAADTTFAEPMLDVFKAVAQRSLAATVVFYDPLFGGVHFLLPTGSSAVPNYIASFFPGVGERGVWTHGASTTDTTIVGSKPDGQGNTRVTTVRGIQLGPLQPAGAPLYTAALYRQDPLLRRPVILAGDEHGSIYRWAPSAPRDKHRHSDSQPGNRFTTLWRSGTLEAAPTGRRAMLHRVTLDLELPSDYGFDLRIERDYDRTFALTHAIEVEPHDTLNDTFKLDRSKLARRELLPRHRQLPLWGDSLGKVQRFELETQAALVLHGIEGEVSRTDVPAHDEE